MKSYGGNLKSVWNSVKLFGNSDFWRLVEVIRPVFLESNLCNEKLKKKTYQELIQSDP